MTASHEAFAAQRRFGSLDGIRALSIIAVVWHHSGAPLESVPLTQNGFLGVDAFFVMSGFLIVTLLLRERDKNQSISLKNFWARRALRIFPVYYAVLLFMAVLFGLVKPDSEIGAAYFQDLPYHLTYTSNWAGVASFGIAWSLATEEQFYVVWPLFERFAPKLVWPAFAVGVIVSQLVNFGPLRPALQSIGLEYVELEILQATFTPILLGVALAHLLHREKTYRVVARVLAFPGAPLVFLAITVGLAALGGDLAGWRRLAIQLALFALVGSVVVKEQHVLAKPLSFAPFARIGVVSYGIYLLHLFPIDAVNMVQRKLDIDIYGLPFLAGLLLTWAAAEVSYRFLEMPFLKLKKRFASGVAPEPESRAGG